MWLRAFLLVLALPLASPAQDTGYISGTVTDKSGAAVVAAEVVLTNAAGSLTRTTTTNTDGAYVISGLPGDTYNLVVTAKGFQKYSVQKVVLNVADKARIDVQLTVGAVSETVEVTGENVAQIETTSSDLTSTITGRQVNQLELNGRNFTQLVTLAPGVVNQTGYDDGKVGVYGNVSYSFNGGRNEYNNWELDGGDNMDNGSNSTLNVYPNVEAIAEFKVLTSNYGAQYGRNGSATVETELKSGGSSFHGSAFEYLRNEAFKAKSWAEGEIPSNPKAPYKKHDFGYTFSGPVYIPNHYNADKKKTFFFFSEEWRREKSSTTILQNVPSDAERGGDFTALCTNSPADCPAGAQVSGNKVTPTAVGTALLALIPHANTTFGQFTNNVGIPAVSETVSSPTTWREELVKIDHDLTKNYRLTFHYIHDSWQTVVPNPLWGNSTASFQNVTTNFAGPGSSFVARLNANISPTLLNEFVASYTADHIFLTTGGPVALPSGFAMGSIFNNGFGNKLPAVVLASNFAYGGGTWGMDSGYFPWHNANPTYTYRDNLTKIVGTHTMQFGAYSAFAQKNEANSPNVQGILTFTSTNATVSTGNAFADLLLGNIASYQQWSKETQYYDRYKIVEPYFQDDWRITKRLTLNLGLRLSLFGTYRERYKQAFNLNPGAFVGAHVAGGGNGNEPGFNSDGSLNTGAGTGNPLNGFLECGGKGGNLPLLPGSAFPAVAIGSSSNAGCLSGHLFNPAPRIGFAFDPKGDGKTAIRGGYGIFFEHTNGNEGNTESLEGSPPLVLVATQSNILGYQNIGAGAGSVPLFPLSVVSIPNKAQWPYVQQWNLGVQRQLPSHFLLSVAYVGSKGTHLTLENNANQLHSTPLSTNPYKPGETIGAGGHNDCGTTFDASGVPTGATTPSGVPITGQAAVNLAVAACGANADLLRTAFPGYSRITLLRDEANSIYHALQVGVKRTLGDLTVSIGYAYSHSIDDSSDRSDGYLVDAYNIAANRASSNFDVRHNLSLSYIYTLPFFKGSGLSHSLLGGWEVSGITIAQTGTPFSATNGIISDNAGVSNAIAINNASGSRPDLVGNAFNITAADQTAAAGTRGPLFYSPSAFANPRGLTFGNVGRNTLYLPRHVNFDFGLFKRFPVNEKTGFEFRAETFNIFNHTEYNGINSSLGGSGFMHLNSTHDPRRMQLGLRFYF